MMGIGKDKREGQCGVGEVGCCEGGGGYVYGVRGGD